MRHLAPLAVALCLLAPPALAQDAEQDRGMSLMERGAELFFRGLMDELDPALKELEGMAREMQPALRSFAEEMGPALRDLMGQVEDWSVYEAPEMLDNGDIIIRRKPPQEALPRPYPGTGDIEL
ncbi:hypothetical protein [Salipiger sp.]|uniref:hypothetical protein n=1 Tax=Salipiger sp. TaxID=2078585 RepID=UPI003A9885C7